MLEDSPAEDYINKSIEPTKKILTLDELWILAKQITNYCAEQADFEFRPYQTLLAERIVYSLISHDMNEITVLFSRQSGKSTTVAVIADGLAVVLPLLALHYEDERIKRFKKGIKIGIFAPTYEQAGIIYSKMHDFLYNQHTLAFLKDPEIGIDLSNHNSKAFRLPNGSLVDVVSAGPGTTIEGKTYDFIILDETQDISSKKIKKSINPMGAATGATRIQIGTPNFNLNEFYITCEHNKEKDKQYKFKDIKESHRYKNHFEFNYQVVQKYSPVYRKYVELERLKSGEDSEEFRMAYNLEWLLDRSRFVAEDIIDRCGVVRQKKFEWKYQDKIIDTFTISGTRESSNNEPNIIAAIDFGRAISSTVITVAKVWMKNKEKFGKETRYRTHILDWVEMIGDDHEIQHDRILEYFKGFPNLSKIIVDATGKGDPIYSRLAAVLSQRQVKVIPFIFSKKSKHDGYTLLSQELNNGRFTFPVANKTKDRCTQNYLSQLKKLQKTWKDRWLIVQKPDLPDAKDDYPDCAMMLCWLANKENNISALTEDNNLYNRGIRNPLYKQRRSQRFYNRKRGY